MFRILARKFDQIYGNSSGILLAAQHTESLSLEERITTLIKILEIYVLGQEIFEVFLFFQIFNI